MSTSLWSSWRSLPWAGGPFPRRCSRCPSPWVISAAAGLYLLEAYVERTRHVGLFWHGLQALARPVAAALIASLFLSGMETGAVLSIVGPLLAAGIAALVHLAKCGWSLMSWLTDDRVSRRGLVALLEDTLVAGVVAMSLDQPAVAGVFAFTVLLGLAVAGRGIFRAGAFAHALAWARSWGSLQPFRWLSEEELPADVAREISEIERPLGRTLKAAAAAGFRFEGSGLFRPGWLVVGAPDPRWVTRTVGGPRVTVLDMDGPQSVRMAPMFLQVGGEPGSASLVFPKSGPALAALEAELNRGKVSDRSWEPWEPWNAPGVDARPPN